MALHLPNGPLKTRSGLDQYRDVNPVPTSPLADDIATAPSGPVRPYRRLFLCLKSEAGQVRTECLTCTFRASCCSARLSRAQVPAFADSSIRDSHGMTTQGRLYSNRVYTRGAVDPTGSVIRFLLSSCCYLYLPSFPSCC